MDPGVWGPYAWKTLHAIASHCDTTQERDVFVRYMTSLQDALPCKSCRLHAADYVQAHPIPEAAFFDYTVDFHNAVNARLGKALVTAEDARKQFGMSCNQSCNEPLDTKGAVFFYGVLILSLFALVLFSKRFIA